jgi:hypothetical protein
MSREPELAPERLIHAIDVAFWFMRLRREPTWQEIATYWGVHRATAFRWRNAYRAAVSAWPDSPQCLTKQAHRKKSTNVR